MSAYPPEVVNRAGEALLDGCVTRGYTMGTVASANIAEEVLDAVTAATPTLRHHDDGRLSLEWADEPAVGALVVVKADVLRRLVDKVNKGTESLRFTIAADQQERDLLCAEIDRLKVLGAKHAEQPSVAPSGALEGGAGVPGPPETDASVNTALPIPSDADGVGFEVETA